MNFVVQLMTGAAELAALCAVGNPADFSNAPKLTKEHLKRALQLLSNAMPDANGIVSGFMTVVERSFATDWNCATDFGESAEWRQRNGSWTALWQGKFESLNQLRGFRHFRALGRWKTTVQRLKGPLRPSTPSWTTNLVSIN